MKVEREDRLQIRYSSSFRHYLHHRQMGSPQAGFRYLINHVIFSKNALILAIGFLNHTYVVTNNEDPE